MSAPPIIERHLPHFHRRSPIKELCRVATTASITISTALNSGDVIDGVTLADGDRVLVKDQSTGSQNGIYVVGSSPVRDYDESTDDPSFGYLVLILQGTANAGTLWHNTNASAPTIGTTALTFAAFTGGGLTDPMTTRGDLIYRNPSNVTARLGIGGSGTVLSSDGTDASWQTPSSGFADPMTTRGDIIYRNPSNATDRLGRGGAGTFLSSDGTDLSWQTPSGGGGGLSGSILGYDTVGGSAVAFPASNVGLLKKVTLSATSYLQSVGVHMAMATLAGTAGYVFLYADSGGSPSGAPLSANIFGANGGNPGIVGTTPTTYSWWEFPLSGKYAAADYWFGIMLTYQATSWNIHYDGSGTDKEATFSDGGYLEGITYRASLASASRKYSMRLTILS